MKNENDRLYTKRVNKTDKHILMKAQMSGKRIGILNKCSPY